MYIWPFASMKFLVCMVYRYYGRYYRGPLLLTAFDWRCYFLSKIIFKLDTDVRLTAMYTDEWLTAKYTVNEWRWNHDLGKKCLRILTYGKHFGGDKHFGFSNIVMLSEVWLVIKKDYIVCHYIILLSALNKHKTDWEYMVVLYRFWQYVNVYLYTVVGQLTSGNSFLNVTIKQFLFYIVDVLTDNGPAWPKICRRNIKPLVFLHTFWCTVLVFITGLHIQTHSA